MKEQFLQLNFPRLRFVFLFGLLIQMNLLTGQTQVRVTSEAHEPLEGVLAYTPGFQKSFITDSFGKFVVADGSPIDSLYFKYLGYADTRMAWAEVLANDGLVEMINSAEILDEVIFIGRTHVSKDRLSYQIEAIDQKNIELTQSQTTVDALSQHANVFVQKSQMGGGSPVIRGFEANKVLLVVDGVRMNNAIYRSGHLQNAVTIDKAILERMEVIYGPNSLLYGSDALGGVIHFKTKKPKFNYNTHTNLYTETHFSLKYSSASHEKSGHLDFNLGGKNLASLTSISFSDYSDLRTGSKRTSNYPEFGKRLQYVRSINEEDQLILNKNPNIQIGTGYSQLDLIQKILIQTSSQSELIFNTQYSTSSDIPRYDQLTEPDGAGLAYAEWYYGPQKRLLTSANFNHFRKMKVYDTARFIAAFQKIDEDRIDRKFGSQLRTNQKEDVKVWSFTADFSKHLKDDSFLAFDYGFDFNFNQLESIAFDENILDQTLNFEVFSRYPSGGSDMKSFGAYAELEWELPDSTILLNGGIRFNNSRWNIQFDEKDPIDWPSDFYSGINSSNKALTWSFGSIFRMKHHWTLQSLISTAFRSPNIDDIGKIRVKGDEVSIPNPDLQAEKSLNFETSISKKINNFFGNRHSHLNLSATGFYTKLTDAIVRDFIPLPGGKTFLIDEGDTLYTVSNVNAAEAYIYGWSANAKWHVNPKLNLAGSINYLKGRVQNSTMDDSPLSHIPPIYGKFSSDYSINDWKIKLLYSFNLQKKIAEFGDSEDNPEKATPDGSPAWSTINVYLSKKIYPTMKINVGFENLLDKHYRPFASGVSAPGFNAIISISGEF